MTTRRSRGIDADIRAVIEAQASTGVSPSDIHRGLEQLDVFRDRVPTLRTVQRVVSTMAPSDNGKPWTLTSEPNDQARAVLDALAAVIEHTQGRVTSLTEQDAKLIARVSHVAPDLPAFEWWRIARLYIGRTRRGENTDDLDAFLAFAPWATGWSKYDRVTMDGWVPHVPYFLTRSVRFGEAPDIAPEQLETADRDERVENVAAQRAFKAGLSTEDMDDASADGEEADDGQEG